MRLPLSVRFSEPRQRYDLSPADPRVLLVRVGVRIVGMQIAGAALLRLIGGRRLRMGAQIVPEGDMPPHLRRVRAEEMQLHEAPPRRIGQRAIAPPGDPKLPMPLVAERL